MTSILSGTKLQGNRHFTTQYGKTTYTGQGMKALKATARALLALALILLVFGGFIAVGYLLGVSEPNWVPWADQATR
ncbi:MAG TPA: hypothetical protein V6D22_16825 [Candidatus Obscuribacterales bacterium]